MSQRERIELARAAGKKETPAPWPGPAPSPVEASGRFDVQASADFTLLLPNPQEPPRMTIYIPDERYNFAIVEGLTVNGSPEGIFVNAVSWRPVISRGGALEFFTQSLVQGATPDLSSAGFRWGIMGSLQEPQPVRMRIPQNGILGLMIIASTAANNTPLTITVRALGSLYL